jgi:hypothetical protein
VRKTGNYSTKEDEPMIRNPFRSSIPRGLSWVAIILIVVALWIFGNVLLRLVFNIAFGMVHLIVNGVVLVAILYGLYYCIRYVSRKTEP